MYYLPDYWSNLCKEGRWLNYLFFPVLKFVGPHLAIFGAYGIVFYYFFSSALPFMRWKYALLFALAGTQLPSLCDLLTWPVSGLPSFLVLGCVTYLRGRLPWWVVLAIGAILFNGAMNNFYNLLPLLYLKEVYDGRIPLLKFIVGYIGFYVAAFALSEVLVLCVSGSWIQVAAWRQPHYIKSLHDAALNISLEFHFIKNHLNILGISKIFICLGLVFALALYMARCSLKTWLFLLKAYAILFISMLATYAQAAPLGIVVSVRTVHALFAGILLLPALIFQRFKIMAILLLLLLSTSMFLINMQSLQYYRTVTGTWYDNLVKIDVDPALYKLLFISSNREVQQSVQNLVEVNKLRHTKTMEGLGETMRWVPAAREAGFKTIIHNRHDADTTVGDILASLPEGEFMQNDFYRCRTAGEWLILGIDWPRGSH